MTEVKMSKAQERLTQSPIKAYIEEFHGGSFCRSIVAELIIFLLRGLSGACGLMLRRLFYPIIFKKCRKPIIGSYVSFKRGRQIRLGSLVALDDFSALEVKREGSIEIGDNVAIGKFTSIVAKDCQIKLGIGSNIGSHSRIASESGIEIGKGVLVASFCYIGPGNHLPDSSGSYVSGSMDIKGGVKIGDNCWIASHVVILDGVTIGEGSVIGANSFVTKNVPPYSLVVGTPARILKSLRDITVDQKS